MFELLQRKVMEPSTATREAPPGLSPPPGLLPVPPTASSPVSLGASVIKSDPEEISETASAKASSFTPFVEYAEDKLVNGQIDNDVQNTCSYDQMLKRRLEMYWKGMVRYQQEMAGREASRAEFVEACRSVGGLQDEDKETGGDVLEQARTVIQKLINDGGTTESKNFSMPWPGFSEGWQCTRIGNVSGNISSPTSLQQASLMSQRALATMLSLQGMQQSSTNLGNLLPPPPALLHQVPTQAVPSTNASPSLTPPMERLGGTIVGKAMLPASVLESSSSLRLSDAADAAACRLPRPGTKDLEKPGSAADTPLDLSLPQSDRKRARDSPPKAAVRPPQRNGKISRLPPPLLCVDQRNNRLSDPQSLANIQSNFPTLFNRSDNRPTQQALLKAHIKNGLANNLVSSTSGPFTSLRQNQDGDGSLLQNALAVAGTKTLNELIHSGVPPVQIQQWLLAAVSAQKTQQLAMNQFTLMQQRRQPGHNEEPPKKRVKTSPSSNQRVRAVPQQPSSGSDQRLSDRSFARIPISRSSPPTNDFTKRGSSHVAVSSDGTSKSNTSPNLSPDSSQNHSGKRYRRYAKPPYSYVSLITLSILSSHDKKLRLSQILRRISEMFPFFNGSYQGWRDSVRHNLSQNECFVKVLKNPYRPTAKGNFWTVNLSSIPHELLLRQNTLVSRYAQDSGYRYRKDLSEVFDLRTGALKVPVPRHLFRNTDIETAALSEDPAAVMEAILLEDTNEDDMNGYKDKIPPEIRRFTLEDLFNQGEDVEDESLMSGGRGRRSRHVNHDHPTQPPQIPLSYSAPLYQAKNSLFVAHQGANMVDNFQSSLHSRALEAQQSLAIRMMQQPIMAAKSNQDSKMTMPVTSVPNPFAAAQTALLSKALATQLQGLSTFPSFQKVFTANQMTPKQDFDVLTDYASVEAESKKLPSPQTAHIASLGPAIIRSNEIPPNTDTDEHNQSFLTEQPSSQKKNKRKGVQPVRRAGSSEGDASNADDSMMSTSPQRSSLSAPAPGSCNASLRTISSEVESASLTNPFSSPVMSSKSHSSLSPRHDESAEYDDRDSRNVSCELVAGGMTTLPDLQGVKLLGVHSLQASKTM